MDESDETVFVDRPASESGVDFEFIVLPDLEALESISLAQRSLPFYFARDTSVRAARINGRREELARPVRVTAGERVTWHEIVRRSEDPTNA